MRRGAVLRSGSLDLVGNSETTQKGRAMPRFYFHLWRGGQLEVDEAGVALPTRDSARRTAERMGSMLVAGTPFPPEPMWSWDIEVTDQTGQTVFIIPICDRHTAMAERYAA